MDHNIYMCRSISTILHHMSRPLYNTAPLTRLGSDNGVVYSAANVFVSQLERCPQVQVNF